MYQHGCIAAGTATAMEVWRLFRSDGGDTALPGHSRLLDNDANRQKYRHDGHDKQDGIFNLTVHPKMVMTGEYQT